MTHVDARPRSRATRAPQGRHVVRRRRRRIFALGSVVVFVLVFGALFLGLSPKNPGTSEPGTPGSAAVGSTAYRIPAHSLFVAVTGSDTAVGSKAHPFRTVQHAVTAAAHGQTIVLRAGVYHERVTVTRDRSVTIQSYPHEAVWFDGSTPVDVWAARGKAWVSSGWATDFDSSPTFERGAPDNTEPGWIFLDPAYPLAAHPDQLWVDGLAQTQVASAAAVVPGTFAVDDVNHLLYLGSDPAGHSVRASDKTKAFSVQSTHTVLRGFGIRRYATSVPGFGAVTLEAADTAVENLVIEDNATTGLFVGAKDITVDRVTVRDNGMLGLNANYADDLRVTSIVSTGNNRQHFNTSPVSGGFKLTRSRGVLIRASRFDDNLGPGLWFDQSVNAADVVSNTVDGNQGHGIILEISSHFVVAGNTISGNRDNGIKVNDTDHVEIWNNTITGNGIDLRIAQDERRASDLTVQGHDPRRRLPDPAMPWLVGSVTVSNNVFSGATGDCVVCVQDYSGRLSSAQLGVTLNGNVYQRGTATEPIALLRWQESAGTTSDFDTLDAFTTATGQEKKGAELSAKPSTDRSWLTDRLATPGPTTGTTTMPARIRTLLGFSGTNNEIGAR